jgi:hypothetical protein
VNKQAKKKKTAREKIHDFRCSYPPGSAPPPFVLPGIGPIPASLVEAGGKAVKDLAELLSGDMSSSASTGVLLRAMGNDFHEAARHEKQAASDLRYSAALHALGRAYEGIAQRQAVKNAEAFHASVKAAHDRARAARVHPHRRKGTKPAAAPAPSKAAAK